MLISWQKLVRGKEGEGGREFLIASLLGYCCCSADKVALSCFFFSV